MKGEAAAAGGSPVGTPDRDAVGCPPPSEPGPRRVLGRGHQAKAAEKHAPGQEAPPAPRALGRSRGPASWSSRRLARTVVPRLLPDDVVDLPALPVQWRAMAALLRRHESPAAVAYEYCATQLERTLDTLADQLLALRDAAATSGYSEDHLGRLVREGKIKNHGRRGRPLIRRGDLPVRRPTTIAPAERAVYDPKTDARELVSRRKGGTSAA